MFSARHLTVAALLLAMFLSAMEATVVASALPTVIAELGGLQDYGGVGSAYLLASTVVLPLGGKLADRLGRKPVLLAGLGTFLLGSLASGLATSASVLILARGVQGLGAGGIMPMVLTVVGDLFPPAERARIQGAISSVWAISALSGPMIGGAIVAMASWRWVFLVNVPFGLASAAVLWRSYRESPRDPPAAPVDLAGAAALVVASGLALLAASSVRPLATGIGALAAAGAFLAVERRAVDPVLPPALLLDRRTASAAAVSLLLGATASSAITYLPLHVQGVLGGRPVDAAVVITPLLVAWPLASVLVTRSLLTVGYRWPVRVGSVLASAGFAVLASVAQARWSPGWLGVGAFLGGLGLGASNTTLLVGVQAAATWERRGTSTALLLFSRNLGGALGVGALGALLASRSARAPGASGAGGAPLGEALGAALDPLLWGVAALAALAALAARAWPEAPGAGTGGAPPAPR